ncbi:MAG: hypothetical protein NC078_02265, partial [Ruminococcus sp.]|nr:hypothetical protein [Ruminococcus sp.]
MKTKRTMKSIAAAALALSLAALPAADYAVNGGFSFGILASAESEPVVVASADELTTAFTNAADGAVIQLNADIAMDWAIFRGGSSGTAQITLDLAGHTLTGNKEADNYKTLYVYKGGITLKSSADGGKIVGGASVGHSSNDGTMSLTIESGSVVSSNAAATAVECKRSGNLKIQDNADIQGEVFVSGNGKFDMTGGTITANGGFGVSTNGSLTDDTAVINISGGTINGGSETAVYLPAGQLNVSNGDITGATGVFVRGGKVDITGGKITANGTKTVGDPQYAPSGDGAAANGDAIVIAATGKGYASETFGAAPQVTISGGEVKSTQGNAVGTYIAEGSDSVDGLEKVTGFVEGGVFESGASVDEMFEGDVVKNSAAQADVTVGGTTTAVIGSATEIQTAVTKLIEAAADGTEVKVDVVQNVETITVPEGVEVTNSTGEDITVNDVVVEDGDTAEAIDTTDPAKFVKVDGTPATCTTAGSKDYYIYDNDDSVKYVAVEGEDGKYELAGDDLAIAVDSTAHDYTGAAPTYTWSADNTACTAAIACKNDSTHVLTVQGTITEVIDTDAKVGEAGSKHKVATFTLPEGVTGVTLTTQNSAPIAIPALPEDDQDLVDSLAAKAKAALSVFTMNVTNETKASEVEAAVKTGLPTAPAGVTVDVKCVKTDATEEATGSAVITVTYTSNGKTANASKTLTITKLTSVEKTDAEKAADAKETLANSWLIGADCSSWLKADDMGSWGANSIAEIAQDQILADTGAAVSVSGYTVDNDGNAVVSVVIKIGDATENAEIPVKVAVEAAVTPPVVNYYSVSLAGDYIGSGITVSSTRNTAGATITVKVPVGYSVDVVSGSNRLTTITDGTGSFTMPAGNVTLRVSSYIGMLSSGYKNAYIYSYDSSMNHITTNSVR